MTMAAVLSDAAHLAQCGMLRASIDASGRPCWASVCDVSPGQLTWSSMLCVDQWPTKHKFYPTTYVENQLLISAME